MGTGRTAVICRSPGFSLVFGLPECYNEVGILFTSTRYIGIPAYRTLENPHGEDRKGA